jgi:rhodanese-related sulfurtransferase
VHDENSVRAAQIFNESGFPPALALQGGLDAWEEAASTPAG